LASDERDMPLAENPKDSLFLCKKKRVKKRSRS
jgi:hypothetical protein